MTRAADDGGEHSPGGIVSGEASFHKAGAIVAHKSGSFIVVTHVGFCSAREGREKSSGHYIKFTVSNILYVTEMLHIVVPINTVS